MLLTNNKRDTLKTPLNWSFLDNFQANTQGIFPNGLSKPNNHMDHLSAAPNKPVIQRESYQVVYIKVFQTHLWNQSYFNSQLKIIMKNMRLSSLKQVKVLSLAVLDRLLGTDHSLALSHYWPPRELLAAGLPPWPDSPRLRATWSPPTPWRRPCWW